MSEIEWTKPNGNKINTNSLPATIKYCEELGWERSVQPGDGDGTLKKKSKEKPKPSREPEAAE